MSETHAHKLCTIRLVLEAVSIPSLESSYALAQSDVTVFEVTMSKT